MKIYRKTKKGLTSIELDSSSTISQVTSATQNTILLSDDIVNVTVHSSIPIDFMIGDFIKVYEKIYRLNSIPSITKDSKKDFTYTLKFESLQYDLLNVTYLITETTTGVDLQGEFLMADLKRFMEILIKNLSRVYGDIWILGECPVNTEYKNLSYDGQNCLQVLQNLCNEYSIEFEIKIVGNNNVIQIKKLVGSTYPFTFEYGKKGGLFTLTRNNANNKNLITRLYTYGGTTNLSTKYRQNKLCLPGKNKVESYIENKDAVNKFGIIENVINFEDIYPTRVGNVSSLGKKYYQFTDNDMFNLNEKDENGTKWLIPEVNAKVHFQTGNLAGYEFDISSYDHNTHTLSIIPIDDERGLKLPNETYKAFQISPGDTYKLLDINLPQSYIDDAEKRLLKKGNEYYAQNSQPYVEYSLSIDSLFLKKREGKGTVTNFFQVGDYIKIKDLDIGVDKSIRIKSFTRDLLNPYKYELTISDTVETNIITNILENVIKNDKIIKQNNLNDPARTRRNWRDSQEVLGLIYDPEGNYYTSKIKPGSIETMMLSVGARSMQFDLINTLFEANYQGDYNVIKVTGETLVHYNISDEIKYWNIGSGITNLNSNEAYYIYARCEKNNNNGIIIFSQDTIKVDQDSTYYHFLIGVLNSVFENVRNISLTYGSTTINGKFIRTGKITSSDGSSFIDLDSNNVRLGDDNTYIEWNQNNDRKLRLKGTLVQSESGDEGLIGVFRGEFDNIKPYYVGDEVTYSGSTYRCKKNTNGGITPSDTTYWLVLAKKGESGDSIYLKGTGYNRLTNAIVKINNVEIFNGAGRGLRLIIADRNKLKVSFNECYDTYGSEQARTDLANKINSTSEDNFIILVSYDAIGWNDDLVNALIKSGSSGEFNRSTDRFPYVFLGFKGLKKGHALEYQSTTDPNAPFAEISTSVINGMFVGTGTGAEIGPSLIFRGEYKENTTYRGTSKVVEAVKFSGTYYISNKDAGEFINIAPTNTSKWTPFGGNFESIATGLLLAEYANIADWILKDGKLTSQQTVQNNLPKAQMNGNNGGIIFRNNQKIYTEYNNEETVINSIEISSDVGKVEVQNSKGHLSLLNSQGIYTNRAGINVKILGGFLIKVGIAAEASGYMNKESWGGKWGLVGVYGKADNNSGNPTPTWGGYFEKLHCNGFHQNLTRVAQNDDYTITNFDNVIFCRKNPIMGGNSAIVRLPVNPQRGHTLEIYSHDIKVTVSGNILHPLGNTTFINLDPTKNNYRYAKLINGIDQWYLLILK